MVNPCCCICLQKGVKIVAVISLLWSIALIGEEVLIVALKGCGGIQLIKEQNPEFGDAKITHGQITPPKLFKGSGNLTLLKNQTSVPSSPDYNYEEVTFVQNLSERTPICEMKLADVIVSVIWILTWFGDIALAIILIYGAYKKSIKLCSIWFHIRCAVLVFRIIFLIIYVIGGLPLLYKVPVMILCVFRLYSLWVVSHFIDEVRHEKEAKQMPRVSVTCPTSKNDLEKFANQENTVAPPPGLTPLW
ncbi:unnamed protein product [Allacma fusca]|uniref:Uncharacterized protein n=2 Tax=Allacma fusca TaxID=39272 RepID=A0A8J2LP42_9HEXA|nr:unnamed protein product [Allacma fusca]